MTNQLYICDPKLNTECKKTSCIHNKLVVNPACYCTRNIMFAKKPVEKVVLVIDVGEELASVIGDDSEQGI